MLNRLFTKTFPFVFIFFFIIFESSPIYLFETQLIKPFMTFTLIYCWISYDFRQFRPLWLLAFGFFYDSYQSELIGVSCLIFLIIYHLKRKNTNQLTPLDFKETWILFIISLIGYILSFFATNYLFADLFFDIKHLVISFLITVIIFPLFNSIVEKLAYRLGRFNE